MANDSPAPLSPSKPELLRALLEPEFFPRSDDRYRLDDLLKYEGQEFVRNAYRAILKREPDEAGHFQQMKMLLTGRFDKVDVLAGLRYSAEGSEKGVHVEGLALPATARRFYRVPVLGYLLELLVALARLPISHRRQRRFEASSSAQKERLTDDLRKLSERLRLARAELTMLEQRLRPLPETEGARPAAPSERQPSGLTVDQARPDLDPF